METSKTVQRGSESWLNDVSSKLKDANYPMDRNAANDRFKDWNIEGESSSRYFDQIEWPVRNEDDFVEKFRRARESGGSESRTNE